MIFKDTYECYEVLKNTFTDLYGCDCITYCYDVYNSTYKDYKWLNFKRWIYVENGVKVYDHYNDGDKYVGEKALLK